MIEASTIAAIANRGRQDSQTLLDQAAAVWRGMGAKVVGVLAEDSDQEGTCSAAFLRDIASGRRFSIRLDQTPPDTACHLDPSGIGDACAILLSQITRADAVVLSKFGKTEAMQQGLWPAFSSTIAAGKPLLTTVSPRHMEAWTAFAPDTTWLEADSRSIAQWWHAAKAQIRQ